MTAIAAAPSAAGRHLIGRLDRTRETPMFFKVFALVSAGMMLDAIDVYMASAVASASLKSGWSTLAQNSWFLSAGFAGLFAGSLLAGFIGDLWGRRAAYQVNLLLFGGFTLLGAFAPNMTVLALLRFGAGVGLGAEIVTGYSMVNEFAPVRRRGRWCALTSVIANCGAPIALLLCSAIIPRYGWRVMFIGVGILAALLWVLRRDIPESPRWQIVHGQEERAAATIALLEQNGTDPEPERVPRAASTSRSFLIGLMVATVAVSATIVCQYTFTSWVPTLLVKRGIDISGSLWLSTLMMLGAPVGCILGAVLVDRIGRRRTIVPAFVLTAVFGVLYALQASQLGAVLVGFCLTTCFYVLMASVVAVYAAELFPTGVRFRGVGVANAVAKLLTVVMPLVVAWALTVSGPWVVFAGISVIALVAGAVVWIWGPETSRRSLG
ncbi:MAG: MFS transporter [Microbacteriaceae bacterium]|jgi:putative MFS transporter|nr:MFS transporter [Microbacteriaceae bacterium]